MTLNDNDNEKHNNLFRKILVQVQGDNQFFVNYILKSRTKETKT